MAYVKHFMNRLRHNLFLQSAFILSRKVQPTTAAINVSCETIDMLIELSKQGTIIFLILAGIFK